MLNKSIGVVLVLVVFFISVVALAWFVDFDATEIGSATLRQASASTGIQLEASEYRINLLRGLELGNIEASARFPAGRYAITMPTMRFEPRMTALLGGRLELERAFLNEPRVAIVTGLEPGLPSTSPSPPDPRRQRERADAPSVASRTSPVVLGLREIEMVGASFSLNEEVSLTGVDVSLRSPSLSSGALTLLHALDATGEISIRELSLRTTTFRNIVATLGLSRGRLDLADGAFETDGGSFQADVHLDFNSFPVRHRLALRGRVAGVPGEVQFEGEGFGLDAANLNGTGAWSMPAGRFDDAPLWKLVELTGEESEATERPFRVTKGRIVVDDDWIRGSIGLDGDLDLIVNGVEVGGTWSSPVRR